MDFFKKGVEKPVKPASDNAPTPPKMQAPHATREYTIERGDTLSRIAVQFYGNAGDWKKIYEANRSTIKNPDLIYPGTKIIIP